MNIKVKSRKQANKYATFYIEHYKAIDKEKLLKFFEYITPKVDRELIPEIYRVKNIINNKVKSNEK